jgi:hypothetical protein
MPLIEDFGERATPGFSSTFALYKTMQVKIICILKTYRRFSVLLKRSKRSVTVIERKTLIKTRWKLEIGVGLLWSGEEILNGSSNLSNTVVGSTARRARILWSRNFVSLFRLKQRLFFECNPKNLLKLLKSRLDAVRAKNQQALLHVRPIQNIFAYPDVSSV